MLDTVDKRTARFTTIGYGTVRDDKTKGRASLGLETRRKLRGRRCLVAGHVGTVLDEPVDGQRRDVLRGLGRAALPGAGGGESRIVVAVTVTGGRLCRATDQTYRLDTPQTRSFLGNYVTLPWLLP